MTKQGVGLDTADGTVCLRSALIELNINESALNSTSSLQWCMEKKTRSKSPFILLVAG